MEIKLQKRLKQVVLPTYFLEDIRLSLDTKGLYAWMFSKDSMWDFSVENILTCLSLKEDDFVRMFNELELFGYVKYKNNKDGDYFQLLDTPTKASEIRLTRESLREKPIINSFEDKCKSAIYAFTPDVKLQNKLLEYLKLRLNPPTTSRLTEMMLRSLADWKTLLNQLLLLSGSKVDIVQQSIDNHWAKFLPLNTNSNKIDDNSVEYMNNQGSY